MLFTSVCIWLELQYYFFSFQMEFVLRWDDFIWWLKSSFTWKTRLQSVFKVISFWVLIYRFTLNFPVNHDSEVLISRGLNFPLHRNLSAEMFPKNSSSTTKPNCIHILTKPKCFSTTMQCKKIKWTDFDLIKMLLSLAWW